jgi:hypothetical protein
MLAIFEYGLRRVAIGMAVSLTLALPAGASSIFSPVGANVDLGGPGATDSGSINDTFNQNGLLTPFIQGENFESYFQNIDGQHDTLKSTEWFASSGANTATVTYDLGQVQNISKFALWNEDASGISQFNLSYSTISGGPYVSLLANQSPSDNFVNNFYSADIFNFLAVDARYVRLDMTQCGSSGCSIGEVAFAVTSTPLPGALTLFAGGLGVLGMLARRKRSRRVARHT